MSSSEQRRASSAVSWRDLGRRAQDRAVDLLHHVEGRVVDRVVVAERERARHRARRSARARRAPCTRGPCRARSAARGRAAGGAAPTRARRRRSAYVRFERPPEISDACSGAPVAPSTCAANHGRSRSRSTPGGVSVIAPEVTDASACDAIAGYAMRAWRGCDGLAVAAGVAGDATDGHVDAEAGGGALFLGLAAPEAVLAVLAGPVAALDERRARRGRRRGPAPRARRGPRGARRRARRTGAVWPLACGLVGPRRADR